MRLRCVTSLIVDSLLYGGKGVEALESNAVEEVEGEEEAEESSSTGVE